MLKSIGLAAALGLLAACASVTTAEPPAEVVDSTPLVETQAEQIERLAAAQLALEPEGALPPGLEVNVLETSEEAGALFYKVELATPRRRRGGENYVLYGQCPPTDLDRCAEQIAVAARMLGKS